MIARDRPHLLLVGASGRIGRMLAGEWSADQDLSLVCQYRRGGGRPGLVWDPLDGPGPLLHHVDREGGFDAIVMVAGAAPGRGSSGDHAVLADRVLAAAQAASIRRILVASSSAIYGTSASGPFSEAQPIGPSSDYGRDKAAQETVIAQWRGRGLEACALRLGNVLGADALLAYDRGEETRTIDVFGNGRGPVRSWIDGERLASILARLAVTPDPLPAVVNLASYPAHSMDEIAEAAGLEWHGRPAPGDATQDLTLDLSVLRSLVGDGLVDRTRAELIAGWRKARRHS